MPVRFRFGAGIGTDAAREAAARFSPRIVGDYLESVRVESLDWLSEQTDETLDVVPEFRKHNERVDGYTNPAVWAEIASLNAIPAWQVLARPCIAHIRTHMGEVEAVLQTLAGARPA